MNLTWVFGVALIALTGVTLLRSSAPEISQFLPFAAIVLLWLALMPAAGEILNVIRDLSGGVGLPETSLNVVLRGLGIGLVTRIASGICNDCGQRALGDTVDYCGQIAVVSLAVPFVAEVAKKIVESEL